MISVGARSRRSCSAMERIAVDVVEDVLVAGAKVVEPGFAVGRFDEAVLGAARVAGEADIALEAVARQRLALVEPELPLLG
jgi:Cft2 family RNA processing exonuclease